jgi:hypothetical protein
MTSLTARAALQIAASYGFHVSDGKWEARLIRDSIIQAREAETHQRSDGRRKSAVQYFDCYMSQYARDFMVEGLAAREFERNVY